MTQHTELIERLRKGQTHDPASGELRDMSSVMDDGADALEAQAREIAELKAQLEATAKNAFEAMPHDIPRRMKRRICVDADWSGSLASRAYIEIRKAFTGEPYKANEDLDAALLEVEALKAQESELCTLYGLAQAECKKLRAEIERLRKDAERWRWATEQAEFFSMVVDGTGLHCAEVSEAESAVDAAIAAKGQP